MRILLIASATALLLATSASAKPPREELPASEQLVRGLAADPFEEELAQLVAAANAHPIGSAGNPVRVGGPEGERAYLARLRCGNGAAPKVGARTDAGVGAFGSLVASYALDCGAAAPGRAQLVFDMYHEEHVETRAPAGFQLLP